jgi:outer membrane protein assembly factor BamB
MSIGEVPGFGVPAVGARLTERPPAEPLIHSTSFWRSAARRAEHGGLETAMWGNRRARGRRSRALTLGLAVVASIVLGAACGETGGGSAADHSWAGPNADLANTRRVKGPIDAASVSRLRLAWTFPMAAGVTSTPVIVDGVAYLQDMASNVYAVELDSGRLLWKHEYGVVDNGPNGVNVGDGRVYGATVAFAFALDQRTGRELWQRTLIRVTYEGIDMAPGYHDGTVFVSTVPAAAGNVATLWALDGATGKPRWRWEQVPRSLWGHPEVNAGGGMWHPPAFDEHGGIYVDIANPVPWPGTAKAPWGTSRPGPNRWNNAIVKLDEETGRAIWGRQVLPHDVYDWDLQCPVILARADGRDVAIAAGKMGFVYAFDADSGELLWKRSVGIHNGHDDDNLAAMRGDLSVFGYGQKIYPGDWGGVQTQLASDGTTVYVPVNNLYAVYHGQELPEQQDLMEGTGEVVALDIATGRVRWDRRLPHSVYGGASISSDVVFTTTYEGRVWGLDTRTGKVLWRAPLPAGADAPAAIAGDMLLVGAGIELKPEQPVVMVAYRLGAKDGAGAPSDG